MSDGWIIPEQLVGDTLQAGLDELEEMRLAQDGSFERIIDTMFLNLPAEKKEQIRTWFGKNSIRILENYPREPQETPCYCLVLDPETQKGFVGDTIGEGSFIGGTVVQDGEEWTSTVGVLCYSENGELLKWIYHIAKFLLARNRRALITVAHEDVSMSGRDFGFDPRFLQAGRFVYRRALMVTLSYTQIGADEHVLENEIEGTDTTPDVVGGMPYAEFEE